MYRHLIHSVQADTASSYAPPPFNLSIYSVRTLFRTPILLFQEQAPPLPFKALSPPQQSNRQLQFQLP